MVVLTSMHINSFWTGSSPRSLVSKVARAVDFPSNIWLDRANEPGSRGQYVPLLLLLGNGDGGRKVEQKNELLFQTSNVSMDVVVNKVAINMVLVNTIAEMRTTEVRLTGDRIAAVRGFYYGLRRRSQQCEVEIRLSRGAREELSIDIGDIELLVCTAAGEAILVLEGCWLR